MFSFHHVSLSVSDLDSSVCFYSTFGFTEKLRWTAPDKTLTISHLALGDAFLELFCYKEPVASDHAEDLDQDLRIVGVRHFALRVRSIDEAYAKLGDLGIRPLSEVREGRTNIRYFFVRDPDDLFVEVVEDKREF